MKKIIKRSLTSKGLLFTFSDGTLCLLQVSKIELLKMIGTKIPAIDDEVAVEPSVDEAGNKSAEWVNLTGI